MRNFRQSSRVSLPSHPSLWLSYTFLPPLLILGIVVRYVLPVLWMTLFSYGSVMLLQEPRCSVLYALHCKTPTPGYWFCCFLDNSRRQNQWHRASDASGQGSQNFELHHFLFLLYLTWAWTTFFWVLSPNCILPHLIRTRFLSALFCVQFLLLTDFLSWHRAPKFIF